MRIVIFGLSITSSWGNGHATTYRGLVRALDARGHDVLFLERDQPWYARNRDLPAAPYGRTALYSDLQDLKERFGRAVANADVVVVGSYVPQGVEVGEWVMSIATGATAFYDIDTPVTLAKLDRCETEYISRALVMRYDLYLSFTGGPTLELLRKKYYAPRPRVLYCSVDPTGYYPAPETIRWDMGYLGTYSADRQPALERMMLQPALQWPEGKFCVAGSLYPEGIAWPPNLDRVEHLPPSDHRTFYNSQRWTLNVTRADMVRAGYSPSVRLFEAAACGTPIISDRWNGLDDVFDIGSEILAADTATEALEIVRGMADRERRAIAARARRRVLADHTAARRAEQFESYVLELSGSLVSATVRSVPQTRSHARLRVPRAPSTLNGPAPREAT
jgi:spore maturation protein CgeB